MVDAQYIEKYKQRISLKESAVAWKLLEWGKKLEQRFIDKSSFIANDSAVIDIPKGWFAPRKVTLGRTKIFEPYLFASKSRTDKGIVVDFSDNPYTLEWKDVGWFTKGSAKLGFSYPFGKNKGIINISSSLAYRFSQLFGFSKDIKDRREWFKNKERDCLNFVNELADDKLTSVLKFSNEEISEPTKQILINLDFFPFISGITNLFNFNTYQEFQQELKLLEDNVVELEDMRKQLSLASSNNIFFAEIKRLEDSIDKLRKEHDVYHQLHIRAEKAGANTSIYEQNKTRIENEIINIQSQLIPLYKLIGKNTDVSSWWWNWWSEDKLANDYKGSIVNYIGYIVNPVEREWKTFWSDKTSEWKDWWDKKTNDWEKRGDEWKKWWQKTSEEWRDNWSLTSLNDWYQNNKQSWFDKWSKWLKEKYQQWEDYLIYGDSDDTTKPITTPPTPLNLHIDIGKDGSTAYKKPDIRVYSWSQHWQVFNPDWKDYTIRPWVTKVFPIDERSVSYRDVCMYCGVEYDNPHSAECSTLKPNFLQVFNTSPWSQTSYNIGGGGISSSPFFNLDVTPPTETLPLTEEEKIKKKEEADKKLQLENEEREKKRKIKEKKLRDYIENKKSDWYDFSLGKASEIGKLDKDDFFGYWETNSNILRNYNLPNLLKEEIKKIIDVIKAQDATILAGGNVVLQKTIEDNSAEIIKQLEITLGLRTPDNPRFRTLNEWRDNGSLTQEQVDDLILLKIDASQSFPIKYLKQQFTVQAEVLKDAKAEREINWIKDWLTKFKPTMPDFVRKKDAEKEIDKFLRKTTFAPYDIELLVNQLNLLSLNILNTDELTPHIDIWKQIEKEWLDYLDKQEPDDFVGNPPSWRRSDLDGFFVDLNNFNLNNFIVNNLPNKKNHQVYLTHILSRLKVETESNKQIIIQRLTELANNINANIPVRNSDPTPWNDTQLNRARWLQTELKRMRRIVKGEELDTGWLTDDNITHIINKHEDIINALRLRNQSLIPTTQAKNWKIRTDLANTYQSFKTAQKGASADLNERANLAFWVSGLIADLYTWTIFPIRISGNHWGIFVLQTMSSITSTAVKFRAHYLSSSQGNLIFERDQLKPLMKEIGGDELADNIQIQYPTSRQNNGYDCGVFTILYILEMLEESRVKPLRNHTEDECQEFRKEWKAEIGDANWCPSAWMI